MKQEIQKIWEVIEYLKDAVELMNETDENEDVRNLLSTIDDIMSD